ncbi:hypothetical protein HII31_13208 [Pseudocercospora fuligena]|uniref:Uncharacterized protein n=1 Tax=Pseudocercospora fuligena TaxID=685502 RepID=A0A8H6VEQ8_9PEZI|nr:hypothetical protein HII31_13211 [Pseudocercospora fuligena]KAF7185459.1 hypothetical protein HII31_13208 [Pseudocercospora fuligena]
MAETAAKPADKPTVVKPERPDEEAYKTNLAKAEKELQAADAKQVRILPSFMTLTASCISRT